MNDIEPTEADLLPEVDEFPPCQHCWGTDHDLLDCPLGVPSYLE